MCMGVLPAAREIGGALNNDARWRAAVLRYVGSTGYELESQVLTSIKALNVVLMDFMYTMLSILVIKVPPR